MIRSDSECRLAVDRIRQQRGQFADREAELCQEGFAPDEIVRAMQPLLTFQKQLEEEVALYERLKRGDLSAFRNIADFGFWLIGARIASGMSQRDLALKLDVHESSVSRDERNEYRGITLERASQIAAVLNVDIRAEWRPVSHAVPRLGGKWPMDFLWSCQPMNFDAEFSLTGLVSPEQPPRPTETRKQLGMAA